MKLSGPFSLLLLLPAFSVWLVPQYSLASAWRDRAIELTDAMPTIDSFADFSTLDYPANQSEDWFEHANELQSTIKGLSRALDGKLNQNDRFDIHQKLYHSFLEYEVYSRDKIQVDYLRKWDAFGRGEETTEPLLDFTESQKLSFQAVNHMRQMLGRYKKHPRLDQVTYDLATSLCRIGNENNRFYFQQFFRQFPKSSWYFAARMAQADCLVAEQNLASAEQNYRQILSEKSLPADLQSYAHYRLAWLWFYHANQGGAKRLSYYSLAVRAFQQALEASEQDSLAGRRMFSVKEEAGKDLAWLYSLNGDEKAAQGYFKQSDRKDLMAYYYFRAGLQFIREGRPMEGIRLFHYLGQKFAKFRQLPMVYQLMYQEFEKLSGIKGVTDSLGYLAGLLDDDSPWTDSWQDDRAFYSDSSKQIEHLVSATAARYHQAGSQQQNKGLIEAAATIYKSYLKVFPDSPKFLEIQFQYANALFQSESYAKAAEQYQDLLDELPDEHELHRDVGFNLILSLTNLDGQTKYPKPPSGKLPEPIDLPDLKERRIEAIESFRERFPNDNASVTLAFALAETYMEYGHYQEAIEYLEHIAESSPDSEPGHNALKVVLSFYNQNNDWQGLRDRTMKYLENPKFLLPDIQEFLSQNLTLAEQKLNETKAPK